MASGAQPATARESAGAFGAQLGEIFQIPRAPSFINRTLQAGVLAVTEIRDDAPFRQVSDPLPAEDAFLATLHIRPFLNSQGWEDGALLPIHTIPEGATLLRDLRRDPRVLIDQPHHSLHFYLPRAAMDTIAEDSNARRVDDLKFKPGTPIDDMVVRNLGASMLGAFALQAQANRMFLDHVMMAVATHVTQAFGGLQPGSRAARGGLTPSQERRAKEFIDANLSGDIALSDLAEICGISLSHFRRAFRESTSLAPHQWLLHRRVDVAKSQLTANKLALAEIALACGFADQSHFTRVFTRLTGVSPGRWRRGQDEAGEGQVCDRRRC